jgi:hypothetical protein
MISYHAAHETSPLAAIWIETRRPAEEIEQKLLAQVFPIVSPETSSPDQ